MAEEERRRILFEINNGDWSDEERREMLLDIESYVQGSVNKRQREERQEERLRLIELLQDHSRYGRVPVVFPDDDDPLVSSDPTPWSDLIFPMSWREYLEEWAEFIDINLKQDDHTIASSDDDDDDDEEEEEDETDYDNEEDRMYDDDDDHPLASSDIDI
jgi:hypothetical protein